MFNTSASNVSHSNLNEGQSRISNLAQNRFASQNEGKVILRNGTMIEADFQNDRIITPLTNDMTSMLTIELPEIVSKTPIPSASNTLDPMNLRRSESRNTISPNFKLQFNGAFHHMSTNEDDRMKISDQMFHVLFRHLPQLKQIYRIYARLGVDLQTNID
ncbi:unnamed protein product, partial [Rotaria socialis]